MRSENKYLFGPWVDATFLGGGSIFFLLIIYFATRSVEHAYAWSFSTTLLIANFVNHPHFAVSYQIFYSDYKRKITSEDYEKSLRLGYLVVGLLAPVLLILVFFICISANNPIALGLLVNLMMFLVGWHYIKQGYGMAMVDAALKHKFFSNTEKNILLINGYSVWLFAWAWINSDLSEKNLKYFEIPYYAIPIPEFLFLFLQGASFATSTAVVYVVFNRIRRGEKIAWAGFAAYLVSLYVWLLVRDPILLLWYPMFHSLQYLVVVLKFQKNKFLSLENGRMRLILYMAISFFLGYYFFWEIPLFLDSTVNYDKKAFGSSLFLFSFWIFINIHHYLIDTVIWRKENIDVKKYLFGY